MSKNGYVIFSIRANVLRRVDDACVLDNLDGNGMSALEAVALKCHQASVTETPMTRDRTEQAFSIDRVTAFGRSVMIWGEAGPYGTAGRTVDIDTGDAADFDERTATMVPLRAMLVIPEDCEDGLLFCERRGQRHLRGALADVAFRTLGRDASVTFRIDTHVDPAAWEQFIKGSTTRKVTYVWRSTRTEDLAPDRRTIGDLKMVADGNLAERVGRGLFPSLISKAKAKRQTSTSGSEAEGAADGHADSPPPLVSANGTQDAVTISNPKELTPKGEDFERARIEIAVGDEHSQRTIVIEGDALPAFIYPFEGRPTDHVLREAWVAHAQALLSAIGVTVDEGWAEGDWDVTNYPKLTDRIAASEAGEAVN